METVCFSLCRKHGPFIPLAVRRWPGPLSSAVSERGRLQASSPVPTLLGERILHRRGKPRVLPKEASHREVLAGSEGVHAASEGAQGCDAGTLRAVEYRGGDTWIAQLALATEFGWVSRRERLVL